MSRIKFKVFGEESGRDLERLLNEWAESLPPGTRIRRTQLAADTTKDHLMLYALVNYELPAPGSELAGTLIPVDDESSR